VRIARIEDDEELIGDHVFMIRQYRRDEENRVILDNGAEISIFSNESLLTNIREVHATTVVGINGHDDGIEINQAGNFLDFGRVYFSPSATANILSFKQARKYSQVHYDPTDDVFTCSFPHAAYQFVNKGGLYDHNFDPASTVLSTFDKKISERIDMVKDVQRKLGFASNAAIAKAILDGSVLGLPITTKDVVSAAKLSGPIVPIIKGKASLNNAPHSLSVDIPLATPTRQALHIDLMFLEKDCFFISVSDPMDLTMVDYVGESKITSLKSAKNLRNFVLGHISTYF
jgi:hypothetical protein